MWTMPQASRRRAICASRSRWGRTQCLPTRRAARLPCPPFATRLLTPVQPSPSPRQGTGRARARGAAGPRARQGRALPARERRDGRCAHRLGRLDLVRVYFSDHPTPNLSPNPNPNHNPNPDPNPNPNQACPSSPPGRAASVLAACVPAPRARLSTPLRTQHGAAGGASGPRGARQRCPPAVPAARHRGRRLLTRVGRPVAVQARLRRFRGALNSTSSVVLSGMERGQTMEEALTVAQEGTCISACSAHAVY